MEWMGSTIESERKQTEQMGQKVGIEDTEDPFARRSSLARTPPDAGRQKHSVRKTNNLLQVDSHGDVTGAEELSSSPEEQERKRKRTELCESRESREKEQNEKFVENYKRLVSLIEMISKDVKILEQCLKENTQKTIKEATSRLKGRTKEIQGKKMQKVIEDVEKLIQNSDNRVLLKIVETKAAEAQTNVTEKKDMATQTMEEQEYIINASLKAEKALKG